MTSFGPAFLTLILGYVVLLGAVKLLGREYEEAAFWQIMIAAMVLYALELALNFFAPDFVMGYLPNVETVAVMGMVFGTVAFVTILICRIAFYIPFITGFFIALVYAGAKFGIAVVLGFMLVGDTDKMHEILTLWERPSQDYVNFETYRDPKWKPNEITYLSMDFPSRWSWSTRVSTVSLGSM